MSANENVFRVVIRFEWVRHASEKRGFDRRTSPRGLLVFRHCGRRKNVLRPSQHMSDPVTLCRILIVRHAVGRISLTGG